MNDYGITTPDGWAESPPEKFEDCLFVSQDTYESGLFEGISKSFVCIYNDNNAYTVECDEQGNKDFHTVSTREQVSQIVQDFMGGGQ